MSFHYQTLKLDDSNLFGTLEKSVRLETTGRGRQAALLTRVQSPLDPMMWMIDSLTLTLDDSDQKKNQVVAPIVRSTLKLKQSAHAFSAVHHQLISEIQTQCKTKKKIDFNHAMMEIYDSRYRTMGFHSDQALDLDSSSYIALFSCYSDPATKNLRELVIVNKHRPVFWFLFCIFLISWIWRMVDPKRAFAPLLLVLMMKFVQAWNDFVLPTTKTILLEHHSVVLFSTQENATHLHKIILSELDNDNDQSRWLGLTFRFSKTWIRYPNPKNLTLATQEQAKIFYACKHLENTTRGLLEYPSQMNYTVSPGDLLPPIS